MQTTQERTKTRPVYKISRERASEFIADETSGLFFCAYFVKKDGTMRRMICRRGVRAYLRGGSQPYDPSSRGLVTVWDVEKRSYRMINLRTLVSFNIHGATYVVE